MDWGEIKEIRMIMTKGTRGRWQASGLHPFMLQPLAFSPKGRLSGKAPESLQI